MSVDKAKYSTILTALAAGIGYGGWAVYANFHHDMQVWLLAGTVQAVYAFFSTLCITHVARWVFLKHQCGIRGGLAGFGMSFLVMLAIPLMVHHTLGTPEIRQTILPGLIWGSIYLIGFLISLDYNMRILPARKEKIR